MAYSFIQILLISSLLTTIFASNFKEDFDITYGDTRANILNNGELITLTLDQASGSGFQSKNEYLFGKFDMQLKLVPGYSAGTVTTFYMSSQGENHDEIDFEFLGNVSGEPYTLHTNVWAQGQGVREQQYRLWFDPTADFHTYSIVWNPQHILFLVDETPIRVFKNGESVGVPYPNNQPMRVYGSIWNADEWATQGGRVKTDWSNAPFTSSFNNFNDANGCVWSSSSGSSSCTSSNNAWLNEALDGSKEEKLKIAQQNYMIYTYCTDTKYYPQGPPPECSINNYA